ncbi:hypothetical protein IE4872_CH03588 [Rhizobium gallicum]|uniref:Uncharacterized protein n=1 Tax=Rhizobium gallicum TaxID=56730 RepID=A0A1L5NMP7_9HYPH|nr:hypothetical protein IE4872_CH03588 [Rhizobium gallicum]
MQGDEIFMTLALELEVGRASPFEALEQMPYRLINRSAARNLLRAARSVRL